METSGLLPSRRSESLPQVKDFEDLMVWFTNEDQMAVRPTGGPEQSQQQCGVYQNVAVQRGLIQKVKIWIQQWISVPVLSCGPGL